MAGKEQQLFDGKNSDTSFQGNRETGNGSTINTVRVDSDDESDSDFESDEIESSDSDSVSEAGNESKDGDERGSENDESDSNSDCDSEAVSCDDSDDEDDAVNKIGRRKNSVGSDIGSNNAEEEDYMKFVQSIFLDDQLFDNLLDDEDDEYKPQADQEEEDNDDELDDVVMVQRREVQDLVNDCWQTIIGNDSPSATISGFEDKKNMLNRESIISGTSTEFPELTVVDSSNTKGLHPQWKSWLIHNLQHCCPNYQCDTTASTIDDMYKNNSISHFEDTNSDPPELTKENKIKIYPNPVKSTMHIDAEISGSEISVNIFDAQMKIINQMVWNKSLDESSIQIDIDVSDLASGIYFVNLASESQMLSTKFIVQK